MNVKGWISRHGNTLAYWYHFCDKIILILRHFFSFPCTVIWFLKGHTDCQHIPVIHYQHKATYLKGSASILSWLCKVPGNKPFLWRPAFEEHLSLFVLCFLLEWDFIRKVSEDYPWSPEMPSLHEMDWSRVSDIPCPLSLLNFFACNSPLGQHKPKRVVHIISSKYLFYVNKRPNLWTCTIIISRGPSFRTCYDIKNNF